MRITLPNVWGIPHAVLQEAGLRQRPGKFVGCVTTVEPDHPFLAANGTNLEIV